MQAINIIGAGLAGCEAAWQLAAEGFDVLLYEMKPSEFSPAHSYPGFAELVCSNSLKSALPDTASGLLKDEMLRLGSLTVPCAFETAVEAGNALAVDREKFSDLITEKIRANPHITVRHERLDKIPDGFTVIATGPLTDGKLAEKIKELCGNGFSFYDAAAPIVTFDSIDENLVFFASRYNKGGADYINCTMNKDEYTAFYHSLLTAETAPLKEFEKEFFKVYEGCMPIEVLAKRGEDAMRFGPLKPVGLTDPRTGRRPYANVQMRKENADGTLYNLVGFQTNLKFSEQKRVFSMITGLSGAEFVRYGVMHRNSFINSPQVLEKTSALKTDSRIYFAGQITGVEGYMESAMSGIIAGKNLAAHLKGKPPFILPGETMCGALMAYITQNSGNFQPVGANMGILPPLGERIKDKKQRYEKYAERALSYYDGEGTDSTVT
ncbi:MAG: methylenetetrahydrofolate--tRNA-(uracil(54)-C(5))-methyltransferase (FADH(2)-oxidizing) TrmFO [Oscillospiraceae bacterium]|jgi:methylenetetrahydrofolate--tRNA-(uracil-5-)-methyltransferase|nr:methylenetetrahydrofolate--tRNA-(uracil(54)-C(5))-methyltransferase (FADH(2)-oxidizing) TrmFO [Oscillospiraceae bacterium]